MVIARKKDHTTGEWSKKRFCVANVRLKSVTKRDRYPLPRMDTLLENAKGKVFSQFDAASGFWQINMSPAAVEKTAFITPDGLFE